MNPFDLPGMAPLWLQITLTLVLVAAAIVALRRRS